MLMANAGTKQLSSILTTLLDQLSFYIGAKITATYNSSNDSYTFTTKAFPQEYHGQTSGFFYINGTIGYDWQYVAASSGYDEIRISRMVLELSNGSILVPVNSSNHVLTFNDQGEIVDSGVTMTTDQLKICTLEAARLFNAYFGKRFTASTNTETITPSSVLCNFFLKSDGMQELDTLDYVVFVDAAASSGVVSLLVGVPTSKTTWTLAKAYINGKYNDLKVWLTTDGVSLMSGTTKKNVTGTTSTTDDGQSIWNGYTYQFYALNFSFGQSGTSGFTVVIDGVKISDGRMYEKRFNL